MRVIPGSVNLWLACLYMLRPIAVAVCNAHVIVRADVQLLISTLCLRFVRVGVQLYFKWTPTLIAKGQWISIPLISPPIIVITVNPINMIVVMTSLKYSEFKGLRSVLWVSTVSQPRQAEGSTLCWLITVHLINRLKVWLVSSVVHDISWKLIVS